ncbi:MAG: hypothetical protein DRJ10_16100 [Bacteroidetes bacterium]|nr:MAG: hypothetical protein DRJ10_16100 [Bacteroidota bacterium]
MIKHIYILGNHIQGLGISRITGKLGYKVTLFNSSRLGVARFSNTCNKFEKFNDVEHLFQILDEKDVEHKTALLIPTNDLLVGFLSDNYDKLNTKYHISIAPKEITEIAFNKRKTYQTATEANIPIPKSYFPDSIGDIEKLNEEIEFPVIIKPAVMYSFYKKSGKKVFLCNNKAELVSNYHNAIKIIPENEVIVQELLNGGAKNLYSYASYAKNGEPYGSFVVNRIRQKPMDFGVATTFAVTVINERVETLAKEFLKKIKYTGVSEVEFMYDDRVKDYKLIEINPRTWKWHSMANIVGINLIEMLIKDIQGQPIEKKNNKTEQLGWIEQLTDFFVMFTEVVKGRMKFKEYLKSLQIQKEYATFDWKDPLPAIMYIILSPYLYFTR